MSYTTILAFRNDVIHAERELRNSYGGAAFIWDRLYNQYLVDRSKPYDSWLTDQSGSLWKLDRDKRLPLEARAVHASTFDHALVFNKDFTRFCSDLATFLRWNYPGGRACHIAAYIQFIAEHADAQAIGFWQTSVNENPWLVPPDDTDEEGAEWQSYNIATGTKHFDVYAHVDLFENKEAV